MAKKTMHYTDERVDPQEVNIVLAEESNKLSFIDRSRIHEEIHGVLCMAPVETPELLTTSLKELSSALDSIPISEKKGLIKSHELFPDNDYVNSRNFRLTFLRCEFFDARKAAMRLTKYLDFVLEIFGNNLELLRRPIRLEDISPKAMKLLRSGCLQLLPVRDNSGRRMFVTTAFEKEYDVVDRIKSGTIHQWINIRAAIEKQRVQDGALPTNKNDTHIIECPAFNDVALRPGRSYLCHPGNVRFKELLSLYVDEHAAANRREKDRISWEIIEQIERKNGRFLEWDTNGGFWVENKDITSIRAKIPVYIRDHRRNTRGKRKQRNPSLMNSSVSPGVPGLLNQFGTVGTPALMNGPPWDPAKLAAAIDCGPHQSSHQGIGFLCEEYADMMDKQQWTVLPATSHKRDSGFFQNHTHIWAKLHWFPFVYCERCYRDSPLITKGYGRKKVTKKQKPPLFTAQLRKKMGVIVSPGLLDHISHDFASSLFIRKLKKLKDTTQQLGLTNTRNGPQSSGGTLPEVLDNQVMYDPSCNTLGVEFE
eukprot:jgi/Psemu1/2731/gm1.2731_g